MFNLKDIKLVISVSTFFLFCSETGNPLITPEQFTIPISFEIGQKWLYKRYFINIGISNFTNSPDTIPGYAFSEVVKDTTINEEVYYIIEGVDYGIGSDTINEYHRRWAVCESDSQIKVLTFDNYDFGFSNGPLKTFKHESFSNNPSLFMYQLYLNISGSQNAMFTDTTFPLSFPLYLSKKWVYRKGNEVFDYKDMYRKYLGQEIVKVLAGTFTTSKIDWLLAEFWEDIIEGADQFKAFDWYNEKGLIKRLFDYGKMPYTDNYGDTIGWITESYDILEFIGNIGINPDTLIPYGISARMMKN